ncbi:MAG TPA: ABC transporter ATP-binding protein [Candidatus Marinimicrobia bacterium]|jgi:subfamily B ATP-binding cassette protein MsbA|nr:ABC transporter ATP-binding protein [Candidatus Neomarinimicrobiota bacterium]HJL75559.1 ABC transporter ATP-binding protein [Candidatus Neomarinimicrobiota bacterium]HJM70671.1 ABC transporter ATP-binding protein [Candidatus Neomarinimicrobiota bacterium]|tara:strand:+ start:331 stop:2160 length:1830 start_codon:yes stop_codon:yes gene_type:complete
MSESLYKRMFKLVIHHWPYLLLSSLAAIVYVVLNSASIWLTASLINNILMDFEHLIAEQAILADQGILTLNEQLKFWTNGLILRNTPQDTLKVLCLTIMVVFLTKNVFLYLKNISMTMVQFHLITEMRNRLYRHFNSLSLSYFNQKKSGELTSIVINDVANLRRALGTSFHQVIVEPINLLAFATLLFIISWKLALMSIVIVPIAGFTILTIGRSIRRKSKRTAAMIAGITNIITETLSSIRVVKAFAMEDYEVNRFFKETHQYFRLILRRAKLRLLASPITETLGVMMGVLLLWVGGIEVLSGKGLTPEDFLRFILLIFAMMDPLRKLSNVNVELQVGAASAERIFSILDTPVSIIDKADAKKIDSFENKIHIDGVSFNYENNDTVLDEISFTIEKGSVVALVGPSGAGKSTLADLIPRFYDVSTGSIVIDGQDIRNVTLHSLRSLMGVVTQETILFNDTVRANIAYGQENIDDEQVTAAAKAANAMEFINELPEGLDTIIGEKGVKLSGGQRQRLAIARAIMKNPPILILDEATSALDTESERLVQEALETLMAERTVLVIAHRLSTVTNADKIIVMDKGKIEEMGTHDELIQKDGMYSHLYNIQFN